MSVVVDTSTWIDFFSGRTIPELEDALAQAAVVLPPIVVAELISGTRNSRDRNAVATLVTDIPVHETPIAHWIRVGELRRRLRGRGLSISTPDAHVAQCALDRNALLLTRDRVFSAVARLTELRLPS